MRVRRIRWTVSGFLARSLSTNLEVIRLVCEDGAKHELRWPAYAASTLVVLCFSYFAGRKGLYLFDFGVNTKMGWLILNGWRPHVDFTTPIPPLCGLLSALAFRLFGVSYMATVVLASLTSATAFLLIANNLRRLPIPSTLSLLFSFVFVLPTLPAAGVFFYNHLAMLLTVLLSSYCIRRIAVRQERCNHAVEIAMWGLAGLLLLTKLQYGIAYIILLVLLAICAPEKRQWPTLKEIRTTVARTVLPCALPCLVVLAWEGFPMAAVSRDLLHTVSSSFFMSSIKQNAATSLGWIDSIIAQPQFTVSFFVLLVITAGAAARSKYAEGIPRRWHIWVFSALSLGVLVLLSGTTAEAPAMFVSVYAVVLLCITLLTRDAERVDRLSAANWLIVPMLLHLLWFSVQYDYRAARKCWIEGPTPGFDIRRGRDDWCEARIPFFAGLRIRSGQKPILESIYALQQTLSDRTFFFGEEFGMMYPATGRMPPRGWPLWFHPGVSMTRETALLLPADFEQYHYDFVVVSHNRYYLNGFLDDALRKHYTKVPLDNTRSWVDVYSRSDNPELMAAARRVLAANGGDAL